MKKNYTTAAIVVILAAVAVFVFFFQPGFNISGQAFNVSHAGCLKEGASAVSGRCCAGLVSVNNKCTSVAKVWSSKSLTPRQKCAALGGRWVVGSGACIK